MDCIGDSRPVCVYQKKEESILMDFLKHIALLQKRSQGKLTEAQQQALQQAAQTETGRAQQRLWQEAGRYRTGYTPDTQAGLDRLRQRLATESAPVVPMRVARRRSFSWGIAATIALALAAITVLWWQIGIGQSTQRVATATTGIQTLTLSDGTTVSLNKGAELRYPSDFGGQTSRSVDLIGEAYFQVAPDAAHPFIIHTPMAEVEVLGTAFNLRAMPGEPFTEVEVAEGKVALIANEKEDSIILRPKECGRYLHQGQFKTEPAPYLNRLAWHTNQLNFVDTPLSKVIPMLERFYEISITGQEQLSEVDCPISGNWSKGDLKSIPAVIESLTPLRLIQVRPGYYLLQGQGC